MGKATDTTIGIPKKEILDALGLVATATRGDVQKALDEALDLRGLKLFVLRGALGLAQETPDEQVSAKVWRELFGEVKAQLSVSQLSSDPMTTRAKNVPPKLHEALVEMGLPADVTVADIMLLAGKIVKAREAFGADAKNETYAIALLRDALELEKDATDAEMTAALRKALSDFPDVVDAAVKARKLAPAQREWAEHYSRRDPAGFERLLANAGVYAVTPSQILADLATSRVRSSGGRIELSAAMEQIGRENPELVSARKNEPPA